jgi:hypothetical protein
MDGKFMCTSFMDNREHLLIGMNFDNNGMKYQLKAKNTNDLVMYVDPGIGLVPSFGIKNNIFFNSLYCDSNGKGLYKRVNNKRIHTGKIFDDIFKEKINLLDYYSYLKNIEVVNGPNISIHCMLVDFDGNILLIEPGRGNLYLSNKEKPYFIMTNFSIIDFTEGKSNSNDGKDRYEIVEKILKKNVTKTKEEGMKILNKAEQNGSEWKTDFSFVFSKNENCIIYCNNREYNNLKYCE